MSRELFRGRLVGVVALALVAASLLATTSLASAEPTTTIADNGPATNRVDLAIIGDGYTAGEMAKYHADVANTVTAMFQQDPYREYRPYFNVHRVDVPSRQSGADHPERGTSVDTAFDATYNCASIQHLLCVDTFKIQQVIDRNLNLEQADIIQDSQHGGRISERGCWSPGASPPGRSQPTSRTQPAAAVPLHAGPSQHRPEPHTYHASLISCTEGEGGGFPLALQGILEDTPTSMLGVL